MSASANADYVGVDDHAALAPATVTDDSNTVYGGCGVEGCRDCFPLFNEAFEPITDNFGVPL